MSVQTTHQYQSNRAVAVLAACIAQTMHESDPTFAGRLVKRLEAAYRKLRDDPVQGDEMQSLELLSMCRELLTGFNSLNGQGVPFLEDYRP